MSDKIGIETGKPKSGLELLVEQAKREVAPQEPAMQEPVARKKEGPPEILSYEKLDVIAEDLANENLNSDKPRIDNDMLPQSTKVNVSRLRNEDLVSMVSDTYTLGAGNEILMDAVFEYRRRRLSGALK